MKRVIELLRVSTDVQDVARQRADLARLRKKSALETVRTLALVGISGTATQTTRTCNTCLRICSVRM